jgi:hypothetical protein
VTVPLARVALAAILAALVPATLSPRPARAEDPPAPAEPPKEDPAPAPADEGPDRTRGYLGYTPVLLQGWEKEELDKHGITREFGVVVWGTTPGSPAEKAGLARGDVILSMDGEALPEPKGVDPKDDAKTKKWFDEVWGPRTKKVKPGDVVTLVVERRGKKVEVKAAAIPWDEYAVLVEAAKEEERSVKVPDPAEAGAPVAATCDFETLPEGEGKPEGFLTVEGSFEVGPETGTENDVLRQIASATPRAFCLWTGKGRAWKDGTVSARVRPQDGMESVGGGIVVRAKDRKNYVVVRVDGVAKDLRAIAVRDGKEVELARKEVPSPKLKTWMALEVVCRGGTVRATLDGKTSLEAKDEAPVAGWCGVSTDQDAESWFDDLKFAPEGAAK